MFDAAIGFGGVKESGFGREGGWDGLKSYLKHSINFSANKSKIKQSHSNQGTINLDRTAKLYIGGKQVRPDGGYSQKFLMPQTTMLDMFLLQTGRILEMLLKR